MKRTLYNRSILCLATGALLAACATTPPGSFTPPPMGTVLSYHRVSNGSYGSASGRIDWMRGTATWQGAPVVTAESPQAGKQYYDAATHGIVAVLNPAGQATVTYDPPLGHVYPLEVGKRWTSQHVLTLYPSGRKLNYEIRYHVEAMEQVQVPAGAFSTWRVVSTDSLGETQRVWTAPEVGVGTVKRVLDRAPTHPQGAGHLEGELIAQTRP